MAGGGELRLRTDDPAYLAQVDRWWSVLLPRMARHLYIRGGNVLMVQVRRARALGLAPLRQCTHRAAARPAGLP